jgi:hypothetical protein
VGVDGEKTDACRVNARDDQIGADVSLVSEEVLLQHGHAGDYSWGPARRQRVQFDVGADQGGCEFGVCSCTGSGTPDLGGDVVKFLAVLRRIGMISIHVF